ncbi:MAG: Crp/Fnr family transcriptional regulator [Bacteroidetes bacterium]|jgi:CRP/FNR family transcriptional regulator|nr:Crp/Fnr family transcriptional regulator [Bacteroidota bacterium]
MQADIHKLFPTLEPALIEEIKNLGSIRSVKAGDMLVKTGQFMPNTQLVAEGLVKVYREDQDGHEFFMYYLKPGQACALTLNCAIRQLDSPVMAKAVQDTQLIALPVQDVDRWMQQYHTWSHFVLDSYRQRYMDLIDAFDQVAFRHMDERLRIYLRIHSEQLKTKDIYLTHQEIANELNSSREVISRLLKKMEENGDIILHRYHLELVKL